MAALDNYIHLTAAGYKNFGSAKYGESSEPFIDSYKAQKEKIRQAVNALPKVNQETLHILEERMKNEKQSNEIQQIAKDRNTFKNGQEELSKRILDAISQKININSNIFNQTSVSKNDVESSITASSLNQLSEARKTLDLIYDRINYYQKSPNQKTLDTIAQHIKTFYSQLGIVENSSAYKALYPTNLSVDGINSPNSLKTDLYRVLKGLSLAETNYTAMKGEFGEMTVLAAGEKIKNLTGEALKKALEEGLEQGGLSRTSYQLTDEFISQGVATEYQKTTGINLYTVHTTQNKVDCTIEVNEDVLNASVKNYTTNNGKATTHLQNFGLIYTLADTAEKFGVHWINLHSLKDVNATDKSNADEVLSETLRYEALVQGNPLKASGGGENPLADTFVVMDPKNGIFKAMSTSDILENKKSFFVIDPLLSNISAYGFNVRQDTPEARVARIIFGIHAQKISVSYKFDANTF
jgi:hypothetical protein